MWIANSNCSPIHRKQQQQQQQLTHVDSLLDRNGRTSQGDNNGGGSGGRLQQDSGKDTNHQTGNGIGFIPKQFSSLAPTHDLGSASEKLQPKQEKVEEEDNGADTNRNPAPLFLCVNAACVQTSDQVASPYSSSSSTSKSVSPKWIEWVGRSLRERVKFLLGCSASLSMGTSSITASSLVVLVLSSSDCASWRDASKRMDRRSKEVSEKTRGESRRREARAVAG